MGQDCGALRSESIRVFRVELFSMSQGSHGDPSSAPAQITGVPGLVGVDPTVGTLTLAQNPLLIVRSKGGTEQGAEPFWASNTSQK